MLPADEDYVELDRFLGLGFWRCDRHFGFNRLGIDVGESGSQHGFGKRLPSFVTGMVIGKNQESIVFEQAVALDKNVSQLGGEMIGV